MIYKFKIIPDLWQSTDFVVLKWSHIEINYNLINGINLIRILMATIFEEQDLTATICHEYDSPNVIG